MAKIFKFLALAVIAGFAGAAVTVLFHIGVASPPVAAADITYVDFLSITLTALALMITILGFFVAAAGVIGWTTIENKLRDHSVRYFKDQLSKDGDLRIEIEELIVNIAHNGIQNYKSQKGMVDTSHDSEDEEYND
ncbi:hypothetical protein [Altererythrobacter sp. Z27]|uniref:hypothetical protein n=1 Tax=Altererythrobacter sp. Z27 TaxID=3461147 RepID=UPI004043E778